MGTTYSSTPTGSNTAQTGLRIRLNQFRFQYPIEQKRIPPRTAALSPTLLPLSVAPRTSKSNPPITSPTIGTPTRIRKQLAAIFFENIFLGVSLPVVAGVLSRRD